MHIKFDVLSSFEPFCRAVEPLNIIESQMSNSNNHISGDATAALILVLVQYSQTHFREGAISISIFTNTLHPPIFSLGMAISQDRLFTDGGLGIITAFIIVSVRFPLLSYAQLR